MFIFDFIDCKVFWNYLYRVYTLRSAIGFCTTLEGFLAGCKIVSWLYWLYNCDF